MSLARDLLPALGRAAFGSVTAGSDVLRAADDTLRMSIATSRRLHFVALRGGTGCSTTAAAVALLLAHRRPGRVLAVDAGAPRALARLTGAVGTGQAESEHSARRTTRRTLRRSSSRTGIEEAMARLLTGPSDLRVACPEPHGTRRADERQWAGEVAPLLRFFDVVVADQGRRTPGVDFESPLDDAHVVVLVTRADRYSIEEALSLYEDVRTRSGARCAIVAADVADVGPAAARVAAAWRYAPVHYLPYDTAPPLRPAAARTATRRARLHLAATLLTAARRPAGSPARRTGAAS